MGKRKKGGSSAVDVIRKKYGDGAIFLLSSRKARKVPVIPTGIWPLDRALGVGGFGRGRIVEVFGPEASGKTTLALHTAHAAQQLGAQVAFVDAEHALDKDYAAALGVDLSTLLISQPDYGEQALEIVDLLVRAGDVGLIVIDSVAALVPKAELEGDMGDMHVGLHARLMSQACRKLTGVIGKSDTVVLFINQIRSKIGVMFGSPQTTTGGNALKFYASQRLDVRRIGSVKDAGTVVAARTRVKVVKNKLAAPYREAEFDIRFGIGADLVGSLLDEAVEADVVDKSGSWFSFQGHRLGQGRQNAIAVLEEDPSLRAVVQEALNAAVRA